MASQPMARILVNDSAVLGAGAVRRYPADVVGAGAAFQFGRQAVEGEVDLDYSAIVGYCFSDVAGTLEIWSSGVEADVNGAAIVANATLVQSIAVAAATQVEIAEVINAPFGRVQFTDGGAGSTVFRLFLRAIQ